MKAINVEVSGGVQRFGNVDIIRFLMVLLIMSHHLYLLEYSGDYVFRNCWVWVDYFFILTGFFTMSHYANCKITEEYGKEAMRYTASKFKKYTPFILAAVFAQYFIVAAPYITQCHIKDFIQVFVYLPYELLLLSSAGFVPAMVAPIWFLSAMLLMLPLLIYMILRFKDLWNILAWMVPVLYYGRMGINTIRNWPNDLVRAFVGMTLGTFVFVIVQKMAITKMSIILKGMFTTIEFGTFIVSVYISAMNKPYMFLLPLLFVIHSAILLSGCSYTARFRSSFCTFLGEISLPMFLFSWVIGTLTVRITLKSEVRLFIYYIGTILVSGMAILIKHKLIYLKRENVD